MYYFDAISLIFSVVLYSMYNIFIFKKLKGNPFFTIQGVSDIVRKKWVSVIADEKNGILAVQTLRNATMNSSFMASTSVLLAVGVLSLTGNGENVRHTWHALNVFGSINQEIVAFKILVLILNFFLAFFCFASSVRLYTHVGFMLGAICGQPQADSISLTTEYLNMGARHFHLGMRSFYFTVPLVLWIFGAQFMVLGTVFLISIVFLLDKTPAHYHSV